MINNEIARLQNRYGNMKDEETATTEENVLNVMFTETDENGNDVPEGIKKTIHYLSNILPRLFARTCWENQKMILSIIKLKTAFEDKEREWIMGDLGLNKDDETAADKNFKVHITKIGFTRKKRIE